MEQTRWLHLQRWEIQGPLAGLEENGLSKLLVSLFWSIFRQDSKRSHVCPGLLG